MHTVDLHKIVQGSSSESRRRVRRRRDPRKEVLDIVLDEN